jgi:hypothetical protein
LDTRFVLHPHISPTPILICPHLGKYSLPHAAQTAFTGLLAFVTLSIKEKGPGGRSSGAIGGFRDRICLLCSENHLSTLFRHFPQHVVRPFVTFWTMAVSTSPQSHFHSSFLFELSAISCGMESFKFPNFVSSQNSGGIKLHFPHDFTWPRVTSMMDFSASLPQSHTHMTF